MLFIGYGNCWLRAYAFYRLSLMQQHDASKHLLPINLEVQYHFSDVWNFICWVSFAFHIPTALQPFVKDLHMYISPGNHLLPSSQFSLIHCYHNNTLIIPL